MITYIFYLIFGSIAVVELKITWLIVCWFSVMLMDWVFSIISYYKGKNKEKYYV